MVIVVQVISRSITIRRCRRIEWHTCFCPFYLSLSRAHYHDITISISLGMCLRLLFRLISSLPPFSLASSRTRAMKKSMAWPRETCSIVSFPSSFPLSVVVFRRLIGYTTRRKLVVLSLSFSSVSLPFVSSPHTITLIGWSRLHPLPSPLHSSYFPPNRIYFSIWLRLCHST